MLATYYNQVDNWTHTFIVHSRSGVPVHKRVKLEFTDSDCDEEVTTQPGDSDSSTESDDDSDSSEASSFGEEVDAMSDMK